MWEEADTYRVPQAVLYEVQDVPHGEVIYKENKMPIVNQSVWDSWVRSNQDPYGKAVIDTARRVMEILDEEPGDFDTHTIVCRGDKESNAGGITGFMAGCVAQVVSQCHSRGDEFRRKWNIDHQIRDEGENANEGDGVLNPALMNIDMG